MEFKAHLLFSLLLTIQRAGAGLLLKSGESLKN